MGRGLLGGHAPRPAPPPLYPPLITAWCIKMRRWNLAACLTLPRKHTGYDRGLVAPAPTLNFGTPSLSRERDVISIFKMAAASHALEEWLTTHEVPSWYYLGPQNSYCLFVGLIVPEILRCRPIYARFWRIGLKLPIHAPFWGSFGGAAGHNYVITCHVCQVSNWNLHGLRFYRGGSNFRFSYWFLHGPSLQQCQQCSAPLMRCLW